MTVYVEDLDGGYLAPQLEMDTREQWLRDPGGLGNLKIVDSPAYSGPHALQISTTSTAITNLITNPSFETNTTGWSVAAQANVNALATSITRITSDSYFGAASAEVVFGATNDAGARFAITGTFTVGVTYGFAIALKSVSGATDFKIKLVSTGTPSSLNSVQTVTATGSWQRFNFTITPTGTVSDVYLAITRATGAVATARIDAAMAYLGSSATPSHYDTTGSYFTPLIARCDQPLDLTEFDGVGIFLYSPSVSFLSTITIRFFTSVNKDVNGDTDYTNLNGVTYFEYTIPGLSGDSVITYGSGVYGVSRYSAALESDIKWTEIVIPKAAFTVKGLSGSPSWGKIVRTEIVPQNFSGGALTVYVDELSGWVDAAVQDAEANRMISMLPAFMWDTDPSRQFFQVVGWEMDRLYGTADRGLDQRLVAWADWLLEEHEAERGYPIGLPGSFAKRRALCLQPRLQLSTIAEFEESLAMLADSGVQVIEYPSEYRVEVYAGVSSPTDRTRILLAINENIPAHLQVSLNFSAFLAGQIVGSPLGPSILTGTTETGTLTDTGSQP